MNEFIQKFANQFDDTDISVFNSETIFKELNEWSSLTTLSVIAMIDESYNINLKGSEIHSVDKLGELFELIQMKKKNIL
jgi:acyl carrier protein